MMKLYTAEQVRTHEPKAAANAEITLYELMERAGSSAFDFLQNQFQQAEHLVVLCGRGNNGGDGYVVARLALNAGLNVTLYQVDSERPLKGDAAIAQQRFVDADGVVVDASCWLSQSDMSMSNTLTIDALLGTGATGAVREPMRRLIENANRLDVPILSLDIPSGLVADTGHIEGECIKAYATVSFVAPKVGLYTGQARNVVGRLCVDNLGIEREFTELARSTIDCLDASDIARLLPKREPTAHKGSAGKVLCCGGHEGMGGAIMLAGKAAHRSGAGMVATLTHHCHVPAVLGFHPECMVSAWEGDKGIAEARLAWCDVAVVGPGLGQNDWWSRTLFSLVLGQLNGLLSDKHLVIDADGLSFLVDSPKPNPRQVITPHPGEAATLLGCSVADIERDRIAACHSLQAKYGGVAVLKGAGTVVCDGQDTAIMDVGHAGMATAGMGDVLTGIIAGMLAQGAKPYQAACLGVLVHGASADEIAKDGVKYGLLASDLLPQIAKTVSMHNA